MEYKDLVHSLLSVSVIHRYRISKDAQKNGLYFGQPVILEYISNNNLCTQKELAGSLHISPPSAATSLKRMEKTGLIDRVADKEDVRKNRLSLTEKGRMALESFRETCKSTDEKMFKGFSREECEMLEDFLTRLYKNLETEEIAKEMKNVLPIHKEVN